MSVGRDLFVTRLLLAPSSRKDSVAAWTRFGIGALGPLGSAVVLVLVGQPGCIFALAGALVVIELGWWSVRVGPIQSTGSLASIRRAMLEASVDLDRAKLLDDVWERGKLNASGLQDLYRLHEGQRADLVGRGLGFVPVESKARTDAGSPIGAWVLPLSPLLTDVTQDLPLNDPRFVPTEPDAAARWERGLPDFAARARADARTRILAQWRISRTNATSGTTVQSLTKAQLKAKCDAGEKGLNHIVDSIRIESGVPKIAVNRAKYGQIMRSSDYLIEEALIALGLCSADADGDGRSLALKDGWLKRALPARAWILDAGVEELILAPRKRVVGLGLAAVVVTWRRGAWQLLFKKRSHEVGTYPDMYHAVPTGMYNSKIYDANISLDQRLHPGRVLLTEFIEELKNVLSLEGFDEKKDWVRLLTVHLDWLLRDPVTYDEFLRESGGDIAGLGAASDALDLVVSATPRHALSDMRIHVTGLVLDLLSLRPEICCVIELPSDCVVDPNDTHRETGSMIRLNDEGADFSRVPGRDAKSIADLASPCHWVRSGYAALVLAHDLYKDPGFYLDETNSCTPVDFGLSLDLD